MRDLGVMLALALVGCGSAAGPGSVQVMREGRPSESYAAVRFECTQVGSSPETPGWECMHGTPASGLEVDLVFTHPVSDLAPSASLDYGIDFQVSGISGGTDGSIWGATGPTSWWDGDLVLTMGEAGTDATFEGAMHTTAEVDSVGLIPIAISFDTVAVATP